MAPKKQKPKQAAISSWFKPPTSEAENPVLQVPQHAEFEEQEGGGKAEGEVAARSRGGSTEEARPLEAPQAAVAARCRPDTAAAFHGAEQHSQGASEHAVKFLNV